MSPALSGGSRDRRGVLVVWGVIAMVTTTPYLFASRFPPAGRRFSGAFFFQDDFLQYLSFAEQASRGAILFYNKFDISPQSPFLINLEWWAAGAFGALLGGRLADGFQLVSVLAVGGLVCGAARLLALAGFSRGPLVWSLLLVATGSGLGWLRALQGAAFQDVPDLARCLYPSSLLLLNAHAATGCALLLWTIAFHLEWRSGAGSRWRWVLTASVLGLARPFDLGTFLMLAGVLSCLDLLGAGRKAALRRAAELLWILPVLVYCALAFLAHPSFTVWSAQNIVPPPRLMELGWALAPALVLIAGGAWIRRSEPPVHDAVRRTVWTWFLVLLGVVAVSPFPSAQQLGTTLGAAILLLTVLHVPRAWLPAASLALAPTSMFILWKLLYPPPQWFVPRDYVVAAEHLRVACRPGDVVLAPIDPSLLIAGLTPCSVVLGHRVLTPGFENRIKEAQRFYDPATSLRDRLRYLGQIGARFVLLPAGRDEWLASSVPHVRRVALPLLDVWELRR